MKSLLTWTERRLLRLFRKLSNRQNFHLKAEMFSFHSKYFVYRELKRAPQKLSFCFKCPNTGSVRILGNIMYLVKEGNKAFRGWLLFANTREKVKVVLVVVLARSSTLIKRSLIMKLETKKTNKQTTTAAATENKQKKTKQNKTKLVGLENFLGEVRKILR